MYSLVKQIFYISKKFIALNFDSSLNITEPRIKEEEESKAS